MLADRASAKSLNFVVALNRNELWWVVGDPNRLRQVLTNIVGNAIKFPDAGSIKLSVDCSAANSVHFVVRDTGIGMSPDARATIFESFAQADSSTTRMFGGTGLGLAISKQLVELMGGKLDCKSNLGSGSSFWFTIELPRTEALARPATPVRQRLPTENSKANSGAHPSSSKRPHDDTLTSGTRILVVDDMK